jgi:diguanylate cyclase (GGDEF)-like protein
VSAQRKDGTTYAEEQTITPVMDEQRRLTHFIAIKQDITERKQHEQRLSFLVNPDALTGLPNRLWLEQALESAVARSRRGAMSVLLLLDLDNFKLVNDTMGHAAGDELLAGLAHILARHLREGDVLARLGGDEFAVLLDSTALPAAVTLAEQLRQVVDSAPFHLGGQVFTLGVSIGVVAVDGHQTAQQLLAQADAAMYTAKEQGRNRVAVYHPEESSTRRLSEANQWVTRIKDALKDNRMVLHYQPVVRLSTGEVAHYEALLRMREPGGGLILPNEFIPAAERFELMPPLDRWVVQQAIRALEEHPGISVVINLSGQSRVDEYLLDYIEVELRAHNVCPDRLGFEITETAAVQDLVRAEGWIRRLKALGCSFALDDFGVGFTSFAYLCTLPVDQIKIDGSFIRTIHQDSSSRDIVHAMYSLAHKLGKETVAEFVENEAILQVLQEIGITYGQGFYLGKPLPGLP